MKPGAKRNRIKVPASSHSRDGRNIPLSRSAFDTGILPQPETAPGMGEDPWELSRPHMQFVGLGKASFFRTLLRAASILLQGIRYFLYSIWLWITVKNAAKRQQLRAERLREGFMALGGMLVKLGQQLSLRHDILPKIYCDELEKLLDSSRPFPVEIALQTIFRQTKRHWSEIFIEFNRNPIGVASMACVYDARLKSGERVAVKVRRPGIDRTFATDFRALDWTAAFLEFLTLARQGVLQSFRDEVRKNFLEELDFRIEARYQELYRAYLKRRKDLHVTAPRVFYEWSGLEVLVSEYVTGIPLTEIRNAVVTRDDEHLARLRELDIDPRVIAKRLIRVSYYTFYECPFFHGDPHPGNIFVRPKNKIVMVDFGACGVFSVKDRAWMWQMQEYYSRGDVSGMVQCVLGIMEPLPMMNIDAFRNDLTQAWWHGYYGIQSKHAEWWERTSFRLWVALLVLFRQYQLPMPLNLFRMIRATLLYDTVAAQLYHKIDVFKEFRSYYARVTSEARARLWQSVICQALTGPSSDTSFRIEQAIQTGKDLLFQVQQFLREPRLNFAAIPDKIFHAIDVAVDLFQTTLTTAGALSVGVVLYLRLKEGRWALPWQWPQGMRWASLLFLGFYIYLYSRKVLVRFRDPDNYSERRSS